MNIEQQATALGHYKEVEIRLNCGERVQGYLKYISSNKLGIAAGQTNFCGRDCHILSIEEYNEQANVLGRLFPGGDSGVMGPSGPHYYEFSCQPGVPLVEKVGRSNIPDSLKRRTSLLDPSLVSLRDKLRRVSAREGL